MRILISTQIEDVHAAAVALCLRDRGHQVDILHGCDFPARMSISFRTDRDRSMHLNAADSEQAFDLLAPEVVWNRRHYLHQMPEGLHPADKNFVDRECKHFTQGTWYLTGGHDAFWVNPELTALRARRKPVQLKAAIEAGFRVPETLMSNDPTDIRHFLKTCRSGAIYKPFAQSVWETDEGCAALFTATVAVADLPADDVLRKSPGIFQEKIEKAYEIRATFMGATCLAARIDSQQTENAQLDWRRSQGMDMPLTPMRLPADVHEKCLHLMRGLGIVFGCVDLIVTPAGDYVFLEVNEMGQFLWVEQVCPDVPMLDAFSQFLAAANPDFYYKAQSTQARLAEYYASGRVRRLLDSESEVHIAAPTWHMQSERTQAAVSSGT